MMLSPAPRILPVRKLSSRGAMPLHDHGAEFPAARPFRVGPRSFIRYGTPAERARRAFMPSFGGIGDHVIEHFDDGIERRIGAGDAGRGLRRQISRRQVALAHARGQRHGVVFIPFVPAHRQCHVARPIRDSVGASLDRMAVSRKPWQVP